MTVFEWIRRLAAEHRQRRTKALVAAAVQAVMRERIPGDVWLVVDGPSSQRFLTN